MKTCFMLLVMLFWQNHVGVHAAPPAPLEPHHELRLEECDLSLVQTGWGKAQRNLSAAGLPLTIGPRQFARGLGVHAASEMTFHLDGRAQRFTAVVGVNQSGGNEVGEVEFRVLGDGKILWKSGAMKKGEPGKDIDVPLNGVQRLRLEVDALGSSNSDHADWAEAGIRYAGAAPLLIDPKAPFEPAALYPPPEKRIASPGDTTYYVEPATGNDQSSGTTKNQAWQSLSRVNAQKLAPGDRVQIGAGFHGQTLKPSGSGSAAKPIVIEFAPGRHEFGEAGALRRAYFVSNAADNPTLPRPIGILLENVRHYRLQSGGTPNEGSPNGGTPKADLVFMGRMIEFLNDRAEDITYSGLTFDLARPTVSEFRVREAEANSVVVQIAEGSTYAIENGKFRWTGDLGRGALMAQEAIPDEGRCWRRGGWDPFATAQAADLGGGKVRLSYKSGTMGMQVGRQFQFRNVERDTVSAHNTRCRNMVFRDCNFYHLPGMGLVSQFTENLTFQNVHIAPPEGTLRTCAAWADGLHFSGCRGDIIVDSCRFSGMQDDPVNVHGTHLRIIEKTGEAQLHLRFMHPQTYGFAAFAPGDEVAVVSHSTLRELPGNPRRKVLAIAAKPGDASGKNWLLTLDGPVPNFGPGDVIDNLTWYPNFTARNCRVTMNSCRGFLITTRGKVLVENNTFNRCAMPAILIEDDAEGWFESGPVQDMTIKNNRFIACGITISPQNRNSDPALPVHQNIHIEDNFFDSAGITAKSVQGLTVVNNRSVGGHLPVSTTACADVKAANNALKPRPGDQ